jgi:hypothetical protein
MFSENTHSIPEDGVGVRGKDAGERRSASKNRGTAALALLSILTSRPVPAALHLSFFYSGATCHGSEPEQQVSPQNVR